MLEAATPAITRDLSDVGDEPARFLTLSHYEPHSRSISRRAQPFASLERWYFNKNGGPTRTATDAPRRQRGAVAPPAGPRSRCAHPRDVLGPRGEDAHPSSHRRANFRPAVHLPLVVPPGCGFRVGGEQWEWRVGEACVFDDTIEHEAWNDSEDPRYILICDVWSPRLSPEERAAIAGIIAATDTFNGTTRRRTSTGRTSRTPCF